jgi:hypothetical protein
LHTIGGVAQTERDAARRKKERAALLEEEEEEAAEHAPYVPTAREVIKNDTAYFQLVFQNRRSLELYTFARRICIRQLQRLGLPLPRRRTRGPNEKVAKDSAASGSIYQYSYDYTADIEEAKKRYERNPWGDFCYQSSDKRPVKSCEGARAYTRCTCSGSSGAK